MLLATVGTHSSRRLRLEGAVYIRGRCADTTASGAGKQCLGVDSQDPGQAEGAPVPADEEAVVRRPDAVSVPPIARRPLARRVRFTCCAPIGPEVCQRCMRAAIDVESFASQCTACSHGRRWAGSLARPRPDKSRPARQDCGASILRYKDYYSIQGRMHVKRLARHAAR